MLEDEIRTIIDRCPYYFTEEDIPNPTIKVYYNKASYFCGNQWKTPAMYWIRRWQTEPPETLRHDPLARK